MFIHRKFLAEIFLALALIIEMFLGRLFESRSWLVGHILKVDWERAYIYMLPVTDCQLLRFYSLNFSFQTIEHSALDSLKLFIPYISV